MINHYHKHILKTYFYIYRKLSKFPLVYFCSLLIYIFLNEIFQIIFKVIPQRDKKKLVD